MIFYHTPYLVSPWRKRYRCKGRIRANPTPGHFEEWDSIKTRFIWDDVVTYRGEKFVVGTGTVFWANEPGQRRRWWMRRHMRRMDS